MHKSEQYGQILLKQKDKQTDNQIKNFALKISKHLPYSEEVITRSLVELVDEKVLTLSDDTLYQKRMVLDNEISIKRSFAGKKGGNPSLISLNKNTSNEEELANTNEQANTDIESEYINDNDIIVESKGGVGGKTRTFKQPTLDEVAAYCKERGNNVDPQQWIDHYTANGWKVGKNPMKDWKAAVRTWERNGINDSSNGNNGQKRATGATATDRPAAVPGSSSKKTFTGTL